MRKNCTEILYKKRCKPKLMGDPFRLERFEHSLFRFNHPLIHCFKKLRVQDKAGVHKPATRAFNNWEWLIVTYPQNLAEITAIGPVEIAKSLCRELDQDLRPTLAANWTVPEFHWRPNYSNTHPIPRT